MLKSHRPFIFFQVDNKPLRETDCLPAIMFAKALSYVSQWTLVRSNIVVLKTLWQGF